MLASVGGALLNPLFHEVGLLLAILFGAIGLGRGVLSHGYAMPAWIGSLGLGVMLGALTLLLRHKVRGRMQLVAVTE